VLETLYYVNYFGNYFEWQIVADGEFTTTQTTKYYYAGGTRVAMQRGEEGTKYLLGDHLGSASVVLNTDGTALGSQGYLPWGEVNFTEGTIPTEYTFTGQFSYVSSFGMVYFNARWFLPELGRFNQPDTVTPESSQGTIAWDRLAGMNNNPIRYNDPSGHATDDGCRIEGCGDYDKAENEYQKKRDYYEQCKENPDLPGCPDWVEIAAFLGGSLFLASGGAFYVASAISAAISDFLTSAFAVPVLTNAAIGAISSMLTYALGASITNNPLTVAGLAGAAVGGAIAGAAAGVATPLAGSLLNAVGMPASNAALGFGAAGVNGTGGVISYYAAGITTNGFDMLQGNDPSVSLNATGAGFTGLLSGGLTFLAADIFPVQNGPMRTLSVATFFMPGRNIGTVFVNHNSQNLLLQTGFATFFGSLFQSP
jgi:RHS repeat-associated protein